MIYILLITGHLIGDFYMQSDKMVIRKKRNKRVLGIHSLLYGVSLVICSVIVVRKDDIARYVLAIICLTGVHFLIDFGKGYLETKHKLDCKSGTGLFLLDQIFHLTAILFTIGCLRIKAGTYITLPGFVFAVNNGKVPVIIVMGILLCGRPSAILVGNVFHGIFGYAEENKVIKKDSILSMENPKVGYYIGIMEREIILLLGIMGQFGAIGFVIAAKSLARFKQLEEKSFAERYLVGTLLSALIAIVYITIYRLFRQV